MGMALAFAPAEAWTGDQPGYEGWVRYVTFSSYNEAARTGVPLDGKGVVSSLGLGGATSRMSEQSNG